MKGDLQEVFAGHLLEGRVNLKDLLPRELERFFELLGERPFRARQVFRWMYVRREADFEAMTDLPLHLRRRLKEEAVIPVLSHRECAVSVGQDTSKYLFRLPDGQLVETVRMRYREHPGRGRLAVCLSTQAGCALACDFCASGKLGLVRHLATWEIVDQVLQIQRHLDALGERVSNVVYMGIGEPLHNFDNMLRSIRLLSHGDGLGIGVRHLAVSTAGMVPQIRRLAAEGLPLRLAVSLHAPDDELRSSLMPINRRWPLAELLEACRFYQQVTGRRITFEYLMLAGINDSLEQADRLARRLEGMRALVNLIPWNPIEGVNYRRSTPGRVRAFQERVRSRGIPCTVRREKGSDIDAACGQLRLRRAAGENRRCAAG